MSVTTASHARTLPAPWMRTARWLLRVQLTSTVWTWGIIALVGALAFVVAERLEVEPVLSIAQFLRHPGVWFGFSLAIITATSHIGLHVATGLTRRAFVVATVVVGLMVAVVWAVAASLALELEGLVYAHQGWPQVAGNNGEGLGLDPAAGFGATLVPFALSFAAGQLSGLLVGMAYYRLGGWWGTAILPLTVAPIFVVGFGGLDTGQWSLVDLDAPASVAVLLAVLVLALTVAAYHLIVRNVPVRNVEA